jgi:hypothetical protein
VMFFSACAQNFATSARPFVLYDEMKKARRDLPPGRLTETVLKLC